MDWVTTSTILDRLCDFDDRDMWDRFTDRFRAPVAAFARRFGLGEGEIDDVVQETLMAFANGLREGKYDRSAGRLSSWLFGIAYRQAANARRRRDQARPRQADATEFWQSIPAESDATAAWDADWAQSMLRQCMERVRATVAEQTFRAFELVARQGRTPEQAAAELGISRDAVYVAKHRVLKQLQQLVSEIEEVSSARQPL